MKLNKRKAIMDDGMNPELVAGARFEETLGIPIIEAPKHIEIPTGIIPFTMLNSKNCNHQEFLGFYEMDILGLESMLIELEPQVVIVYGSMPHNIFDKYGSYTKFVHIEDWITQKKGGTT